MLTDRDIPGEAARALRNIKASLGSAVAAVNLYG